MNLNFVKKKENLFLCRFAGDNILELYEDKSSKEAFFRAFNFDPQKNTLTEISPEVKKYKSVYIQNCMFASDKFYFAGYVLQAEEIKFSVYKYDFSTGETDLIFDFTEEKSILDAAHKLKIFVLDESNFIIQTESLSSEDNQNLMGVISFDLVLYNTDNKDFTKIEIPDFINNGINSITPLSRNKIMVKCGYSCLEDKRIAKLSENEALIESIYFTSVTQFIADISLNKTIGNIKLIDAAYFDKCISNLYFKDEFVMYKIVDIINNSYDVNFININTLERFKYKSKFNEESEKITPLIICNTPYIKTEENDRETFLNLTNALEDMEFANEKFICSHGGILIFQKQRRNKSFMRIYSYPYLGLIYEEPVSLNKICFKDNEYYLYI